MTTLPKRPIGRQGYKGPLSFRSKQLSCGTCAIRPQCELVHTAGRRKRGYARSCARILFGGSAAHGGDHPDSRTGFRDFGGVPHRMIFQEAQTDHAARVQPITARLDMQLRQICYFLALCEEQSFTRAARRCGISQPSLTNAIIALEQELGGALFERRRGIWRSPCPPCSVTPYIPNLQRIAENVNCIRDTAQALSHAWAANRDASPTTLRVRNERIGGRLPYFACRVAS